MLVALAWPLTAAAEGNDFYVGLLHRGISHFDAGQYEAGEKELRIAAFGLVDAIPEFETAQVYLAIAGDRLHIEADARRAAQRVIAADRVERRFGSLTLPANIRKDFDAIASKLLTSDQYAFLRGSPSSAAPSTPAPAAPVPVAPAQPTTNPKSPPLPAPTPAPVPAPQPRPQVSSQPPTPAPVVNVNSQMALADKAIDRNDLAGARAIYGKIVTQPGLDHGTLIRLGEQSYRARDFATAIRAFSRSGFNSNEQPYRYYYAVALYETGEHAAAKRELALALPAIEVTPDVAAYRAKIEAAR
jgi:tetratricopeptide (TPR) repeat protein